MSNCAKNGIINIQSIHPTGCESSSGHSNRNANQDTSANVCAVPLLGRFLCSQQLDCNWLQSKAVPKSSVKAGGRRKRWVGVAVGGREKKKKSCEIWDTVCRVCGWKGISCIGHLSGPRGCKDSGLGVAKVWDSDALMVGWCPMRWGQASGREKITLAAGTV